MFSETALNVETHACEYTYTYSERMSSSLKTNNNITTNESQWTTLKRYLNS